MHTDKRVLKSLFKRATHALVPATDGTIPRILMLVGLLAAIVSPGVPADDFPQGCVSCHVVLGEGMDKRLGIVLDAAGHRSLKGKVEQVPTDCLGCHESLGDPPFASLIHLAHFAKPETNVFVARFGGDCRHCHVMNDTTGVPGLKAGERNWQKNPTRARAVGPGLVPGLTCWSCCCGSRRAGLLLGLEPGGVLVIGFRQLLEVLHLFGAIWAEVPCDLYVLLEFRQI